MRSLVALESGRLEPGTSRMICTLPIVVPLRGQRLVLEASVGRPELRYYRRGIAGVCAPAGGSRRRGQRASELWAIRCLIDRATQPPPLVAVDSILIGSYEYLLAPVPISMFRPDQLAGFELGTLISGTKVHLRLRNYEDARVVVVAGVVFGEDLRERRA